MHRAVPRFLMVALAFWVITGCTTSPTGRHQMMLVSEAQVAQMGEEAFNQLKSENPASRNASLTRYVNCVANAIIPVVPGAYAWEVVLFEDDSVNAFALPGGKIGVFTGLLKVAENQHQLATVIGHEIAHVIARHSAARVSTQLATQLGVSVVSQTTGISPQLISMGADLLLTLPYSRGDETEADRLGLDYMARAGFDPSESVILWQNMERASGSRQAQFMSTHPAPQTRIQDLQKNMPRAMAAFEQARAQGRRPACAP